LNKQQLHLKSKIVSTSDSIKSLFFKEKYIHTERRYVELVLHLEQNYPNYYNLKYNFDVLSINDVQQKLSHSEALIEYFTGDDQTHALVVTRDSLFYQTLSSVSHIQVENYRQALQPDFINGQPEEIFNTYTAVAYSLYQQILAPLLENVDQNKITTLKIIPDGLLNLIPFETLTTRAYDGLEGDYKSVPYIIKQFNISYGYSTTSLFKMKSFDSFDEDAVLAFAPSSFVKSDETNSLNPLKWNTKEVRNIEAYFDCNISTKQLATEANFKEKIQQYPITHLAMHAVIDHEDPMYSKLLFAPPQDTLEDGMLHTFELYNMRLNTKMSVLSACNTGSGKLQKGEGVMSLARAFAYAGCPSVVMSHWAVDDKSTAKLMKYFYENLSKGLSKDVALRNAKLDFLENSSPVYHHPYYWNNFVIMGDNKPIATPDVFRWWMGLIFIVVVLLVVYTIIIRRNKSLNALRH
jgi:CHAT domain-containing protein